MSTPHHDDAMTPPDAQAIQMAAAEWIIRHDHGLTKAERDEFAMWLQSDERHRQTYTELQKTWGLLDRVPAERVPLPLRRTRPWFWAAAALATAAAVAFGVYFPGTGRGAPQLAEQRAATPLGGFERLELPDGSVVRINTSSALSIAFSETDRRVTLERGEASFDVAKDAARPFIVRAGAIEVRAVGTAFNVRQQGEAIDVLVTEGRVTVDDATSGESLLPASILPAAVSPERAEPRVGAEKEPEPVAPVLSAGQRVTIASAGKRAAKPVEVVSVAAPVVARALAWHERQLEFSNEPLENIAAEFNRYNAHRLVIADAALGAQRFGGKFPANDFQTLVALLEANFGVVVDRRENETVLHRAPRSQ